MLTFAIINPTTNDTKAKVYLFTVELFKIICNFLRVDLWKILKVNQQFNGTKLYKLDFIYIYKIIKLKNKVKKTDRKFNKDCRNMFRLVAFKSIGI